MDIQNSIYSRFAVIGKTNDDIVIDVNGFITRLLLFDKYIVDSIRLQDIPQLVKNFGLDGLIELLNSGALKIHCDALSIGQVGQATVLKSREEKGALPLCSYDFVSINIADREKYISNNLKATHIYVPNTKDAIKLKRAILYAMVDTPKEVMTETHSGMKKAFLERKSLVKLAIDRKLSEQFGDRKNLLDYEIDVSQIGDTEFKADTNLEKQLGIGLNETHKIIERGLLDISGLFQRLSYMKNFNTISWFHDNDMPLLNEEIILATKQFNSVTQENRFLRILDIKGLPAFNNDSEIDINKVLKLRASQECLEFRTWLKSIDNKTDKEITEAISSLFEKVSSVLRSGAGQFIRFIVSSSIGISHPIAGVGLGILDEFVIDNITKKSGPISFINNSLPKLYEHS